MHLYKLGFVMHCFFCVTMAEFFAAQFIAILHGFATRCLFGVVSYIRGSKTGYSVQSQLTNLSRIKEERTDSA